MKTHFFGKIATAAPWALVGLLLAATGGLLYQRLDIHATGLAKRTMRQTVGDVTHEAGDLAREILEGVGREPGEEPENRDDARDVDPLGQVIQLGQIVAEDASKILDEVAGLSLEEERELGREVHELIARNHQFVLRREQQQRILRLAEPLLARCRRSGLEYRFFIIQDESVNAFAHLGGYVYVHTGLLEVAENGDALQFVLGHEIAHGELRHCVRQMTPAARSRQIGGELAGALASVAYQAIALGYSEENEFAADRWAYDQMRALGRTHTQSLGGLAMLERHYGSEPEDDQRQATSLDHLERHFRSHPPVRQRITRLESTAQLARGRQ